MEQVVHERSPIRSVGQELLQGCDVLRWIRWCSCHLLQLCRFNRCTGTPAGPRHTVCRARAHAGAEAPTAVVPTVAKARARCCRLRACGSQREYRQRRGVVVVRGNGIEERGSLLLSRHRSQLRPSGKPSSYPIVLRCCACSNSSMRFRTQWTQLSAISAAPLAGLSKKGLLCEIPIGLRSSWSVTQVHLGC